MIVKKKEQIAHSQLLNHTSNNTYSKLICLGLGPLNKSVSQWQLSWFMQMNADEKSVYDPIFEKEDLDILVNLQITVKELYMSDCKNTLFYMPHCEYQLMEKIAYLNLDHLENITFIGTSYNSIRDKRFYSDLSKFAPTWTKFVNTIEDGGDPIPYRMNEIPLCSEEWIDPHAFNDMCVISFEKC